MRGIRRLLALGPLMLLGLTVLAAPASAYGEYDGSSRLYSDPYRSDSECSTYSWRCENSSIYGGSNSYGGGTNYWGSSSESNETIWERMEREQLERDIDQHLNQQRWDRVYGNDQSTGNWWQDSRNQQIDREMEQYRQQSFWDRVFGREKTETPFERQIREQQEDQFRDRIDEAKQCKLWRFWCS